MTANDDEGNKIVMITNMNAMSDKWWEINLHG